MSEIAIPATFVWRMTEAYGAEGEAWAAGLPAVVAELRERWGFDLGAPFEPLSYSFVAEARAADSTPAVLRIAFPDEEQRLSLRAMGLYGQGIARTLASDETAGAALIERACPGTPLSRAVADDAEATVIAAQLMQRLWRTLEPGHGFRDMKRWTAELADFPLESAPGIQRLPALIVVRAQGMLKELLASEGPPVLLHGDLHHENILDAGGGRWVAIDPKGIAGEREFEVGAYMMNPIPGLLAMERPRDVLDRRIDVFAQVPGLDRERVRAWSFVYPVLSACWSAKHGEGEYGVSVAELLA